MGHYEGEGDSGSSSGSSRRWWKSAAIVAAAAGYHTAITGADYNYNTETNTGATAGGSTTYNTRGNNWGQQQQHQQCRGQIMEQRYYGQQEKTRSVMKNVSQGIFLGLRDAGLVP